MPWCNLHSTLKTKTAWHIKTKTISAALEQTTLLFRTSILPLIHQRLVWVEVDCPYLLTTKATWPSSSIITCWCILICKTRISRFKWRNKRLIRHGKIDLMTGKCWRMNFNRRRLTLCRTCNHRLNYNLVTIQLTWRMTEKMNSNKTSNLSDLHQTQSLSKREKTYSQTMMFKL